MKHISRPIIAIFSVLAGLSGVLAVATPSQAAGVSAPAVALPGSVAPTLPTTAVRLGAVSADASIKLDVTLNVRNQAALTAYLADISNAKSPLYHHFLSTGQFGPMFGPALSQVDAVESALRSAGLSPGAVSSNRLSIPVTATAAAIDRAFGTDLISYRMPGGRTAYANATAPKLPAAIEPLVSAVIGLNDLYPQQNQVSRPTAPAAGKQAKLAGRGLAAPDTVGPQPCADATAISTDEGSLTANELAAHYGMSPLYGLGDLGSGVKVALVEFEPNLTSDISAYEACYGISTKVNYVKVDGGAGTGDGSGEAALDIEDVAGLAPHATIDVYQAPNTGASSYDDYDKIVTSNTDKVISTSWGLCEDYTTADQENALEALFEQANAQDQTVFAAAGDTGSTGCLRSEGPDESALNVLEPSSAPYVIGVGGTTIGDDSETVWNDSGTETGAGGGGLSIGWCMPSYQYQTSIPGLINADSVSDSSLCPASDGHYLRQVPDVSADADPYSGYVIDWDGSWIAIGGTSAAAPLWAAIAALIDASPFCSAYGSGNAGVLPEGLYGTAAAYHSYIYPSSDEQVPEVLADITSGNNDYTPSGYDGGLYPAGAGYDEASGLGVPLVTGLNASGRPSMFYPGLAALMCKAYATKLKTVAVSSVSPSAGKAGHSATVTVHGSGFLPIAGADMAIIGSAATVTASCSSSTTCTVTVPALAAGTVNIRISVEDFPASPITSGDRYTYANAPTLTSLSPNRGAAKGGTKVTIHGTNFYGVTSVHFGAKAATNIKVVSATEVTVTAPSGSGTVHVTVTAGGGTTSSTVAAGRFTDVAAPTVSSLSPSKGSHNGGTKVTIHGTNFTGVTSVHFGAKAATNVKVVSGTEITVTSPKGSGTVHVSVTAVGGTSGTGGSGSKYTYN